MYIKYLSGILVGLLISGCGGGGGSSDFNNAQEKKSKEIQVVDGYIKNSYVLVDINTKTVAKYDNGDINATTDNNGSVILDKKIDIPKNTIIYATGGINIATNEPFNGTLSRVYNGEDKLFITPLSTMVAAKFKAGANLEKAKEELAKAFNIDSKDIDDDPTTNNNTLKATQQIVAVANILNNDVGKALNDIAANLDQDANLTKAISQIDANKSKIAQETIDSVGEIVENLKAATPDTIEKYIKEEIVDAVNSALSSGSDALDVLNTARSIDMSIINARECLTFDLIKGDNSDPFNITKVLNLDAKSACEKDGVTISWINENELTANDYSDKNVTLEANITKNNIFSIKSINLVIKAKTHKPLAVADSAVVNEDENITIDILANDIDEDGFDNSTITIEQAPNFGIAVVVGKKVLYTPKSNYNGKDSFKYKIIDELGANSIAEVNITIMPVNDAPIANDDNVSLDEDTNITIDAVANDTDIDSNLTISSVTNPKHGVAKIVNNKIVYTPTSNYFGTDSLSYEVSDGEKSATANINIEIKAINDAPVLKDIPNQTVDEDSNLTLTLSANDVEDDNISYSAVSSNGSLVKVEVSQNRLTLLPLPNKNGSVTIEVTAKDSKNAADHKSFTLTVNPVNDAPVLDDVNIPNIDEDSAAVVVDLNASDVDGDSLTFSASSSNNTIATVSVNANKLTITPQANQNGDVNITVSVSDGSASDSKTLKVVINPVNDAPVANDINITTRNDASVNIELNASDIDSNSLSYSIVQNPSHGSATISSNIITYTPNNTYVGADSIVYQVSDGELSANATINISVEDAKILVSGEYKVVDLGSGDINKTIHIEGNESKSLYILFTNATDENATITVSNSAASAEELFVQESTTKSGENIDSNKVPIEITKFNNNNIPPKDLNGTVRKETYSLLAEESEGDKLLFHAYKSDVNATLRKVVSNVDTNNGSKTLKIWVADNTFGDDCEKSKCLTQDMVNEMADAFLKDGLGNDIYDWVSNIYGQEWGPHNSSRLIPEDNEITILLLDINEDDSANGGTLGYFWSMENYKKSVYSKSNERVMFFIDSVMYANRGSDGTSTFWKIRLHSTLAHELQHMIHYYQRNVKRGVASKTWFNEMLSGATQDAVASKIGDTAIRGIDPTIGDAGSPGIRSGRFPGFNDNNDKSLTNWVGGYSYSLVASFATYIMRNYGGVKVLGDMQHYDSNDVLEAVTGAVNANGGDNKTYEDLLKEWGVGVILSDFDDLPDSMPRYNFGDFIYVDINGVTYDLGSINFFNYNPLPKFYTDSGTINDNANYYYKVGEDLSGDVRIDISIPSNVKATLIAK